MWGKHKKVAVESGAAAPSFKLKVLEGDALTLQEILARGPALLAFYKVSCPVCQLTFPYLERLGVSSKIQVIGISQDDESSTRAFNQRYGVTFPTLLDSCKEGYPASNAFGITSVPALFLVEPGGEVSRAVAGFSKRDMESLGERAGVKTFRPEDNVPEWKAG